MSCPWCRFNKSELSIEIPLSNYSERPDYYSLIDEKIEEHFNIRISILSHKSIICKECGSLWKFDIEYGNIDPRDSSLGADWYRLNCTKKDR